MTHPQPPNPPPTDRARHSRAAGFSLVELSVALAISAVVMMALGSAMVLASRALPDKDNTALASHDVGRVLEQLSTNLQHALYVSEREAHAITFTVADRTGDGSPQRMRYAWSGEPGDPLTWQLDDHDPIELLPHVETFSLDYEQESYTQSHAGPMEQGVQSLASSHGLPASEYRSTSDITSSDWIGQVMWPDFTTDDPDEIMYWRPTYISYRASKPLLLPPSHSVRLVVPELDHRPSSTVLAERTQSGSLLGSTMDWRSASFADPPWLKPGQPVNLVIRDGGGSGTAARVEYDNNALAGGMTNTTSGQSGWEAISSSRAVIHALYAVPYTAGPSQSLTRHHLTRVRLNVQASGRNHPVFDTAVHLPNRPGTHTAYWEAEFHHDPTGLDVNGDGESDWLVDGGSSFATGDLDETAGTWRARQTLRTWPDHDFTEPTVVHLRMRHTSADSGVALMRLYADRRNGYVGPIGVHVQRQSDGQQTLDLITRDGSGDIVTLTSVPGLSSGFLDVRLVVLPVHHSVHLTIDGVDHGTHRYQRVSASGESRAVELTGWGTDNVAFKHIRVTVGGGS